MKTERTSALPLFYTQGIGSLPRPQAVRDLLAQRREMEADRFQKTMDDMVRFAIALQEQAGMDVITDGEWRRVQYVEEVLDRIGGPGAGGCSAMPSSCGPTRAAAPSSPCRARF